MGDASVIRSLLGSTRGEILARVYGTSATVATLAQELGLTRNAVRVHLATLERDGLVAHTIVRHGVGKPAHLYEATGAGRALLSRAHGPVLSAVFGVLAMRLAPDDFSEALRETGHNLGLPAVRTGTELADRVEAAIGVLRDLGAEARVERSDDPGELVIRGQCCPLADLVSQHVEACLVAESMLETIIGAPVRECCDRERVPACRFVVAAAAG